jgi:PEP-CTERM motif
MTTALVVPAMAAPVTETYTFSGNVSGEPFSPAHGTVTVTFDPTAPGIQSSTSGISIQTNIPVDSTVGFTYHTNTLAIGGVGDGGVGVLKAPGPANFVLTIPNATGATSTGSLLGTTAQASGFYLALMNIDNTFASRVSNAWKGVNKGQNFNINDNVIDSAFTPNLSGLPNLQGLAQLGGFDHFNILQEITEVDFLGAPIDEHEWHDNHSALARFTGIDPLLGGNPGLANPPSDNYPWYYDEVPVTGLIRNSDPGLLVDNNTTISQLTFHDEPNIGSLNRGITLKFSDYLVGVYADHTGVKISDVYPTATDVNFKWSFTQGFWGGTSTDAEVLASAFDPPDPAADGSIEFLGYFGNDPTQLDLPDQGIGDVPEPSTLILLGSALLSIVTFGRYGRKASAARAVEDLGFAFRSGFGARY